MIFNIKYCMDKNNASDYKKNFEEVKRISKDRTDYITNLITVKNPEKIALGLVGSDARFENAIHKDLIVSPLEFILLGHKENASVDNIELSNELKEHSYSKIDRIDLSNDDLFYIKINGANRLFSPSRLLDYLHIVGNKDLYDERLENAVNVLLSPKGKKIVSSSRKQVSDYEANMVTGSQTFGPLSLDHYDLDKGEAIYDPKKKLWSFKQGPNRFIQFATTRDILKLVRDGYLDKDGLNELPKNIVDKIDFLEDNGLYSISKDQINNLADNYMFFLNLYQNSQKAYLEGDVKLSFDSKEVKERINYLANLSRDNAYFVKTKN